MAGVQTNPVAMVTKVSVKQPLRKRFCSSVQFVYKTHQCGMMLIKSGGKQEDIYLQFPKYDEDKRKILEGFQRDESLQHSLRLVDVVSNTFILAVILNRQVELQENKVPGRVYWTYQTMQTGKHISVTWLPSECNTSTWTWVGHAVSRWRNLDDSLKYIFHFERLYFYYIYLTAIVSGYVADSDFTFNME